MSGAPEADDAPAYACQLRLGRPGVRLRLVPPRLEWTIGPQQGEIMLADIARVRLTWRPGQIMSSAYHLELVTLRGLRLEIGSVSRVSIAGTRDQGPAYAAFVRALHRALAASEAFSSEVDPASREENATTQHSGAGSRIVESGTRSAARPDYLAGFPRWRWRLMVVLLAAAVAAALAMGWQAVGEVPLHMTLFVAFMLVAVAVPAVASVIRNRPQPYPDGIPPERMLPQADA